MPRARLPCAQAPPGSALCCSPTTSRGPVSHSPLLNEFRLAFLALNYGICFVSCSAVHHPHPRAAPGQQGPSTSSNAQQPGASSRTLHAGPQGIYFAEPPSGRLSEPIWRDLTASLKTSRLTNCWALRAYLVRTMRKIPSDPKGIHLFFHQPGPWLRNSCHLGFQELRARPAAPSGQWGTPKVKNKGSPVSMSMLESCLCISVVCNQASD